MVLVVRRQHLIKVVQRIKRLVPQELVHNAVDFIRATLRRRIYDSTRRSSKLRGVRVRLYAKLLQRIHRRDDHIVCLVQQIRQVGVVVDSIEQEVVLQRPRTVCAEAKPLSSRDPGSLTVTPAESCANCTGFRPFSGNSSIVLLSMSWLRSELAVSSTGALPVTSTDDVTVPV